MPEPIERFERQIQEILLSSPVDGDLDFSPNHWTAYVQGADFDRNGNFLTLSPTPQGYPSIAFSVLLLAWFRKMAESAQGQQVIKQIAIKYLDTIGGILEKLHTTQGSNAFVAISQLRVSLPIYSRLGMMSPKEALQMSAWLDHVMGEMLRVEYVSMAGDALKGAATIVTSARGSAPSGGTAAQGLPALLGMLQK